MVSQDSLSCRSALATDIAARRFALVQIFKFDYFLTGRCFNSSPFVTISFFHDNIRTYFGTRIPVIFVPLLSLSSSFPCCLSIIIYRSSNGSGGILIILAPLKTRV